MTQSMTILPLPDDISSSRKLKPLVEQANEWVADIVATWPTPVTVEWYRVNNTSDDGEVGLRLTDKYANAHGVFRPVDLANSYAFHGQLHPVLSALTRASLAVLLKQTHHAVATAGAD